MANITYITMGTDSLMDAGGKETELDIGTDGEAATRSSMGLTDTKGWKGQRYVTGAKATTADVHLDLVELESGMMNLARILILIFIILLVYAACYTTVGWTVAMAEAICNCGRLNGPAAAAAKGGHLSLLNAGLAGSTSDALHLARVVICSVVRRSIQATYGVRRCSLALATRWLAIGSASKMLGGAIFSGLWLAAPSRSQDIVDAVIRLIGVTGRSMDTVDDIKVAIMTYFKRAQWDSGNLAGGSEACLLHAPMKSRASDATYADVMLLTMKGCVKATPLASSEEEVLLR